MKNNYLFSFNTPCPTYSNKVVSLNNVGKWLRYHKSKISNTYKDNLKDLFIPEASVKLKSAWIVFKLYRHNKRVLDSDNLGFIIKWTIDAIKEQGWLIDDNQITYTVFPSVLDKELEETQVSVEFFESFDPSILDNLKEHFTFNTPCPTYSNKVVSLNNIGKWLRYHKSKISNTYKDNLKDLFIPDNKVASLSKAHILFYLNRHNKRVLDSDNLGIIIKWTIDAIKEQNWLIDDDKVIYTVFPSVLDKELEETQLKVSFNSF